MYEAAGILVATSNSSPEVCPSVCLFVCLFVCLSVCLSVSVSVSVYTLHSDVRYYSKDVYWWINWSDQL